jgi:hypothetical protein
MGWPTVASNLASTISSAISRRAPRSEIPRVMRAIRFFFPFFCDFRSDLANWLRSTRHGTATQACASSGPARWGYRWSAGGKPAGEAPRSRADDLRGQASVEAGSGSAGIEPDRDQLEESWKQNSSLILQSCTKNQSW